MFVDTHCHLDFKDFDMDRDDVLKRAYDAGARKLINVGSSMEGSARSVELAIQYEAIYASVGVHPHHAGIVSDGDIKSVRDLAKNKKVVAIGEVGLDYYRNLSPKEEQIQIFRKFIHLSLDLDLPLILHAREAEEDILTVLKRERKGPWRGVMHCFSGGADFMKECLDLGFHISFTANITFKKADKSRLIAKCVPQDRLLIETDSPYLAPQAMRGMRNEPSYIYHTAKELAGILNLSVEDVARVTTHNASVLFGISVTEPAKIAYPIRDSIYLNITNRCTNSCVFCVRNETSFVKGHNLRLSSEPSVKDILDAVGDPAKYREVVFCGYGEPTLRLDLVKAVAIELKRRLAKKIRLVTNGHGDLINRRRIAGELAGYIDRVSVSLNTDKKDLYEKYCIPEFGPSSYESVIGFIKDCLTHKIEVEVTCLDLPGVDMKACEDMAHNMGASFRARSVGVIG